MDEAIPAWRQVSGATLKTGAEKMMPAVRTIGILLCALAAGCAGVNETPPSVMAPTEPLIVDPSPDGPAQDRAAAAEPSPAAADVTLLKDLTSVMMVLGLPCGRVVAQKQ